MQKTDKTYLFEEMPIPRAVASLTLPSVVALLVTIVYSLSDTFFVGQLNNAVQTASVALASPVLMAFNAVTNLFGVGSSSMMSRALGRGDRETVHRSAAFGLYGGVLTAFVFALLCTVLRGPLLSLLGASAENRQATADYLFWTVTCGAIPAITNIIMGYLVRAEGAALHASIGTMSGCLLNLLLDPLFILPQYLGMGSAGAGCATFLSNCTACVYFLVLLRVRRGRTFVSLHPKWFTPDRALVTGVCAVGIPAMVQNLLNVTGMTVLNNAAAAYGSDAVAAMGISNRICQVSVYLTFGVTQGIMPLVGYCYASRRVARMRDAITFSAKVALSFLIPATVCIYLSAGVLVRLFIEQPAVVAYGEAFMHGMCLTAPFMMLDFLGVSVYQACGMGRRALLFAVLRKIVLEIPLIIVLNLLFPLYGLAYAQPTTEILLSIAAVWTLRQIIRRAGMDAAADNSH